jgi:phage tail-like protein
MADISDSDSIVSSGDTTAAAPSAHEQTTGDGISRRILLNGAAAVGGAMMAAAMVPSGAALAQTPAGQIGSGVSPTRFDLSSGGVTIATFDKLLGITSEATAAQFLTGGTSGTVQISTFGLVKPTVITLRRPSSPSLELWKWYELVRSGNLAARKNAVLSLIDSSGHVVAKFSLPNAYPTKLELTTEQGVLEETATFLSDQATRTG